MKKEYIKPQTTVIEMESQGIICTSGDADTITIEFDDTEAYEDEAL